MGWQTAPVQDVEVTDPGPSRRHGARHLLRLAAMLAAIAAATATLRARGYRGVGAKAIVRCREGHLFTTWWIPGVSLKSIRLGMTRFQRCPIGSHWTFVRLVKDDDLSEDERAFAVDHLDAHLI
jgi:hypothetical protein